MNLDDLAAEFDASPRRMKDDMSAAIWGMAEAVAEQQRRDLAAGRRRSPIARSIAASGVDGSHFEVGQDMVAEAGPSSPLAPLIEFGTRTSGPHPFVFQGVDRLAEVAVKDITRAIDL